VFAIKCFFTFLNKCQKFLSSGATQIGSPGRHPWRLRFLGPGIQGRMDSPLSRILILHRWF